MDSRTFLRKIWPVAIAIIFLIALRVVWNEISHLRIHDVKAALDALPASRIGLAALCAIGSYLAMTLGELIAVRYASSTVRYLRVSFASFVGSSFNNSVGLSGLLGGTLRFRLYTSWGLSAADVAKVIGFQGVTLWLGFSTLAGVVLIEFPLRAARGLPFELPSTRPLGVLLLCIPAAYLLLAAIRPIDAIRVRGWSFPLPRLRVGIAQIAISTCDWLLLTSTLYFLIPRGHLPFGTVAAASLLAHVMGVASNLPGGLGVFDAAVLTFLSDLTPAVTLFAALIAFRIIYYLVPLSVAALLIVGYEIARNREFVTRVSRGAARVLPMFVPQLFAVMVFLNGVVLLASGATPGERQRLQLLRLAVPLPVIEASHLLASITGVVLLLLARGLQRRINVAYVVSLALLVAGATFSLLKGFDYEEATILFVTFVALLPCRRHFYRRAAFLDEPFTRGWIVAIFLVISATLWLGFFSYRYVPYSTDIWWHFSFHGMGDASRFLRASVAAAVVALAFGIRNLLKPSPARPALATTEEINVAQKIAHDFWSPNGNLVLLGDKSLLIAEDRTAFLMYGVEGRSWVAMGDPIGSDPACRELAWRFLEEADRHDGWTVFYQVRQKNLPLYVDLGLTLLKLGEEARVPLENFSMEGGERKQLRKTVRRVESEGVRFRVVPPAEVPEMLPRLRVVSDEWLAEKHTSEKRFSLGFFHEDYLRRLPVALVENDRGIVAFANLWTDDHRGELTIDLMRHRNGAPDGVMDYLFVNLMQWAAAEGFRWFNLGMAPLSGLEARSIGPRWARLGAFGFRHGEYFYNFRGLRKYKEKFDPVWEPIYLACPGGFKLPVVLTNIAALISGSARGVVTKRAPGASSIPEDDHSRSPSPA